MTTHKQANESKQATAQVDATATVEGDVLVLRVPLTELGPSSSGKTNLVASLNGNRQVPFAWNGRTCRVGVTAFYKPAKA